MVIVSLLRAFLQRIALGFVAVWGVLTIIFALFTMTRHWVIEQQVALEQWGGEEMTEEEEQARIDAYLAERNLDGSTWDRYTEWMWNMITLDWGESFETGQDVFPMVMDATARTILYVVPAVGLALIIGLVVGVYAAMQPDGHLATMGVGTAYLLFAIPNFYVGGMLISLAKADVISPSPLVFEHTLPILLTATSLLGGYVSFSRAHSLEYVTAEFVTLVRAKGATPLRVTKHVLRNGAIPMFSMVFTEALALLVLAVFVIETLFGIQGLGLMLFEAVETRDLPVLLGGVMVLIAVGVIANIFQDVFYTILDPRVDTESR